MNKLFDDERLGTFEHLIDSERLIERTWEADIPVQHVQERRVAGFNRMDAKRRRDQVGVLDQRCRTSICTRPGGASSRAAVWRNSTGSSIVVPKSNTSGG